ncbi:MAG: hypothetical protein ACHQO8_05140, partial [Vicinamibacterales bacterium]
MTRFLVLTPAIDGADGISELSRQIVRALAAADGVEVWALAGGRPERRRAIRRGAAGSRARFV